MIPLYASARAWACASSAATRRSTGRYARSGPARDRRHAPEQRCQTPAHARANRGRSTASPLRGRRSTRAGCTTTICPRFGGFVLIKNLAAHQRGNPCRELLGSIAREVGGVRLRRPALCNMDDVTVGGRATDKKEDTGVIRARTVGRCPEQQVDQNRA